MAKLSLKKSANNYSDVDKNDSFVMLERNEMLLQGIWCVILVVVTVFFAYCAAKTFFFESTGEHMPYVWLFAILLGVAVLLVFVIKMLLKVIIRAVNIMKEDKLILDNVVGGTMISHFDDRFTIKYVTPMFYKMLGYNVGELKQKYHSEFYCMLVGNDSKREFARQKRFLRETGTAEAQYQLLGGNGDIIWVSSRSMLTKNSRLEPIVYTVLFDITNEKRTQQRLALAEARNRVVLEKTESCVFEWDLIKNNFEASELFVQRFNVAERFVISDDILMEYLHVGDKKELYFNIQKLMDGSIDNFEIIVRLKDNKGEYTHNSLNITSLRDNNYVPVRAIGFVINVEEQYRKEKELRKKAAHDSLTGLYNKGATENMITSAIQGHPKQNHALLIIDVDDFKSVNDTLGHGSGDEALKLVSRTLTESFMDTDIIGRVGGDEFMVLATNIGDTMQRITDALDNIRYKRMTVVSGDKCINLTLSIGISTFPNDAETYEDLYKKSDIALYESKHNGKDQYTFYKS